MLAILLLVLKAIGILLLLIVGLLLLILLSILFMPVRYRLDGKFLEEEAGGEVRIRWCGPVFCARAGYGYGKDLFYDLRLFGLLIFASGGRKTLLSVISEWQRKRREKKAEKERAKEEYRIPMAEETETRVPEEEPAAEIREEADIPQDPPAADASAPPEEPSLESGLPEEEIPKEEIPEEETLEEKALEELKKWWYTVYNKVRKTISDLTAKAERFLERLEENKDSLEEKVEDLYDKYETLEAFYYKNRTQEAVQKMIGLIRKVILYVLPKKWRGYLRYGFTDPSWTGKTYGGLCMTGIALRRDFRVEPDFEEAVLEAELSVRGRIRMFFFVRIALMLFFDKELKAVYREGKKIIGGF